MPPDHELATQTVNFLYSRHIYLYTSCSRPRPLGLVNFGVLRVIALRKGKEKKEFQVCILT